jgi:hypothetical protein
MNAKKDPEIAARELRDARQEQGYLAGELIDNLRAIRDSAMDGRECPEWLRERLQDAEGVLARVDAARFGVSTASVSASTPVTMPRLHMTGMRCQEASQFSRAFYIPCGKPATKLVLSERGRRLYPMCEPCADHNVRNRGAKLAAVHEAMDV